MSTPAQRKLLVGLIGAGIQQSQAPAMHEEEARFHAIRLHYQLIDLDRAGIGVEALPSLLNAARNMGFAGLNITYPCKQAIIRLLDELSDEARVMSAVNTVVFRGGKTIGHNTDGSGWGWAFRGTMPSADLTRVVLLGAPWRRVVGRGRYRIRTRRGTREKIKSTLWPSRRSDR